MPQWLQEGHLRTNKCKAKMRILMAFGHDALDSGHNTQVCNVEAIRVFTTNRATVDGINVTQTCHRPNRCPNTCRLKFVRKSMVGYSSVGRHQKFQNSNKIMVILMYGWRASAEEIQLPKPWNQFYSCIQKMPMKWRFTIAKSDACIRAVNTADRQQRERVTPESTFLKPLCYLR